MKTNQAEQETTMDIVLCIDTGINMQTIFEAVKHKALELIHDCYNYLNDKGNVNEARLSLIAFPCQGESKEPYSTNFFSLVEEAETLKCEMNKLIISQGVTSKTDVINALNAAIESDWQVDESKTNYHIIICWSNAGETGRVLISKSFWEKRFDSFVNAWRKKIDDGNESRLAFFTPWSSFWKDFRLNPNVFDCNPFNRDGLFEDEDICFKAFLDYIKNPEEYFRGRNIDFVFCIDATAGMFKNIESIKRNVIDVYNYTIDYYKDFMDEHLLFIRAKVIVFRDLKIGEPMEVSKFYKLPEEEEALSEHLNRIEIKGGGDEPESALEALTEATRSNWSNPWRRGHHIIVLWTDASAHMESLKDFRNSWEEMNHIKKRLIVFAPEASPWKEISENLDNCVVWFAKAPHWENYMIHEIDLRGIMSALYSGV